MMYESFRTHDRLDMVVTLDYMIKPQYPGDNNMHAFKSTWLEIIGRMRPQDVPSETALHDTLYDEIKDSPLLKMELLVHYDMLQHDYPEKTYRHLLVMIDRVIMPSGRRRTSSKLKAGLKLMVDGKDSLAAPAKKKGGTDQTASKKGDKPNKNEDAAPVLPKGKAKSHAKSKAGKGRKNSRSDSADSKGSNKMARRT